MFEKKNSDSKRMGWTRVVYIITSGLINQSKMEAKNFFDIFMSAFSFIIIEVYPDI